jgi:murein DD-endopeptidase MepM/ murein hydrolase activator NlpD
MMAGCVTIQEPTEFPLEAKKQGVYHKVKEGETLWLIAQSYGVDINEIIESNNIPQAAHIENDQLIFIPGAEQIREIVVEEGAIKKNKFEWPIQGKILYYFGQPSGSSVHKGITIQSSAGETVKAAREGRVVFADYLNGYAQTVILDHLDGYYSVYAQNSHLLVKLGDVVRQGSPLAQLGGSGPSAFLYFEIRREEKADNPLYYLP